MDPNFRSAILFAICTFALWKTNPTNALQNSKNYDADFESTRQDTTKMDKMDKDISDLKNIVAQLTNQVTQTKGEVAGGLQ